MCVCVCVCVCFFHNKCMIELTNKIHILFVDKVMKSDHKNGVKRAGCEFSYIAI